MKLPSGFEFFIKTTKPIVISLRKSRLSEMYFDLIQFSLKPKYYGKLRWEQNEAYLKIIF